MRVVPRGGYQRRQISSTGTRKSAVRNRKPWPRSGWPSKCEIRGGDFRDLVHTYTRRALRNVLYAARRHRPGRCSRSSTDGCARSAMGPSSVPSSSWSSERDSSGRRRARTSPSTITILAFPADGVAPREVIGVSDAGRSPISRDDSRRQSARIVVRSRVGRLS